ncbi:MaoC family dehydratase [soil metagenome]
MSEVQLKSLAEKVGQDFGYSHWLLVDQRRINQFADATNDHQWIHVDVERAKVESPLKSTIAHGYLTLSLIAGFATETFVFSDVKKIINYGLNRVRFISPVLSGSRVRAKFVLKSYDVKPNQSVDVSWETVMEIDGGTKPACIAEIIFRYFTV